MASQSQSEPILAPPTAPEGDANQTAFFIQQMLARMQTATLVRVVAVRPDAGCAGGFVDVVPMVNQIDGLGNAVPHVTVFNVPYFGLQGGANAIIIAPEVDDIGPCVFASRDITKVKNTRAPGNPGSMRTFSYSDGLYFGGMLNGAATQFVKIDAAGVLIKSPVRVKLEAPSVVVQGPLTVNGDLTLNGNLTQTGNISLTGSMLATGTVHASNIP